MAIVHAPNTVDGKVKRTWRGRSMTGCSTCRARRVKCDEMRPVCRNCAKGNRTCDYQSQSPTQTKVSPIPGTLTLRQGNHAEGETFHRFLNRLAPLLGGFFDPGFWTRSVPSAAQGHEPVFNATIAVANLYETPKSDPRAAALAFQQRHRETLEYRAGNADAYVVPRNQADISLLLLSSVLYLFVAIRQLPHQELSTHCIAAFADVYTARAALWNCKDPTVLASLAMLVDISTTTTIDSSQIPRPHRLCCIVLAIKIASDIQSSELYQLKFELASITYDLNDLLTESGLTEADLNNEMPMEDRLQNWFNAFSMYRSKSQMHMATQLSLTRLQSYYLMCRVRAELARNRFHPDRQIIEHALTEMLDLLEDLMHLFSAPEGKMPPYALELGFVAGCLVVAWHWRHPGVLERSMRILTTFPPSSPDQHHLINTALWYYQLLIQTPYEQATDVELQLFGRRPHVSLLVWQQQRASIHLVMMSKQFAAMQTQQASPTPSTGILSVD